MFKPIEISAEAIKAAATPLPEEAVNNIFKVMHGFYGNLFLSKFASGEVGEQADKGIVSARQIWGHGLRKFGPGTVKAALAQCIEAHPEFPPSLPQFVALCRANAPREAYRAPQPAIGMSQALSSQYTAKARAAATARLEQIMTIKTGYIEVSQDLTGLKLAIANAVACAGGDEVAELRRLDAMFSPGAAA